MPALIKLLVTGGGGQVASALIHHPAASRYQLLCYPRTRLDITSRSAITTILSREQPHYVINTAAYTAVDRAEQEPLLADQINHQGVLHLATECEAHRIPLIHLSTDYVFDGKHTQPYQETDTVNPLNQYGRSKWLGEEGVRAICKQAIILRVSGVFSEYGHNFYKTMLRLQAEQKPIQVVSDQITGLTDALSIAEIIFKIIQHPVWGTYHYCGAPAVSWHQFAEAILKCPITAVKMQAFVTAATRPRYTVLNCDKICETYGVTQPSWQEGLKRLLYKM